MKLLRQRMLECAWLSLDKECELGSQHDLKQGQVSARSRRTVHMLECFDSSTQSVLQRETDVDLTHWHVFSRVQFDSLNASTVHVEQDAMEHVWNHNRSEQQLVVTIRTSYAS